MQFETPADVKSWKFSYKEDKDETARVPVLQITLEADINQLAAGEVPEGRRADEWAASAMAMLARDTVRLIVATRELSLGDSVGHPEWDAPPPPPPADGEVPAEASAGAHPVPDTVGQTVSEPDAAEGAEVPA